MELFQALLKKAEKEFEADNFADCFAALSAALKYIAALIGAGRVIPHSRVKRPEKGSE